MSKTKTILQVPLNLQLKREAEKEAQEQGFSSLQEAIRVFLKKLSDKKINVSFEETVALSEKSDRRYERIVKDYKEGRNIMQVGNVKDLMKKLHEEDSLS